MQRRGFIIYTLVCFFSLFYCEDSLGQSSQPFNFVMPTMLNQNNNVAGNVSHFTGKLGASVPIYSYKSPSSNIDFNISFDYTGGGLNIYQNASSIGAGWELNAGGAITRTINGLPDDLINTGLNAAACPRGYFNAGSAIPDNPCSINYQGPGVYPDPVSKICQDSEEDGYYFNFNGRQGLLTIPQNILFTGSTSDIKTVPQSTCKVSFIQEGLPSNVTTTIGEIVITDEKGIVYHFAGIETMQKKTSSIASDGSNNYHYNYTFSNEYYVVSWKLTKIVDRNTNEEIDFTYQDYSVSFKVPDFATHFTNTTTGTDSYYYDTQNTYQGTYKRLTAISFKNGDVVSFIYDTRPRVDFISDRALRQVKVQNSVSGDQVIYNLKQGYLFQNVVSIAPPSESCMEAPYDGLTPGAQDQLDKWLFFKGITRLSKDGSSELPIAQFGYYRDANLEQFPTVPPRFSAANADIWGYAWIPHFPLFGCLDTIYNVNGGYTFYEHEQNDLVLPIGITGVTGGLRVKSITQYDGISHNNDITVQYSYLKADGSTSSGFVPPQPPHTYNNAEYNASGQPENYTVELNYNSFSGVIPPSLVQGSPIGYSRVVESIPGQGKTVYEYTTLDDYPPLYTSLNYPFPNKTQLADWAYGLPKMTTVYDNNGAIVKTIENDYNVNITTLNQQTYRSMKMAYQTEIATGVLGNQTCAGTASTFNFKYEFYYPVTGLTQLTQTITKDYDVNGNAVTSTVGYNYDPNYYTLTKTVTYNSKGEKIENIPFYLYQISATGSDPYTYANLYNLLGSPVGSLSLLTKTDGTKYITAYGKTSYQVVNGVVEPFQSSTAKLTDIVSIDPGKTSFTPDENYGIPTSALQTDISFDRYDQGTALLQSTTTEGNQVKSVILDPVANQVIATANAPLNDISYTSFENSSSFGGWTVGSPGGIVADATSPTGQKCYTMNGSNTVYRSGMTSGTTYIVSYWSKSGSYTVTGSTGLLTGKVLPGGWTYYEHTVSNATSVSLSGTGFIDELRIYPKSARMTTSVYQPLVGIVSQCNESNYITYYEYDGFGRVNLARDQDRNIIKKFCYSYAGLSNACDGTAGFNCLSNNTTTTFTVTLTNITTGVTFGFTIPASVSSPTTVGSRIPAGMYNIQIVGSPLGVVHTVNFGSNTYNGPVYTITFNNVSIINTVNISIPN